MNISHEKHLEILRLAAVTNFKLELTTNLIGYFCFILKDKFPDAASEISTGIAFWADHNLKHIEETAKSDESFSRFEQELRMHVLESFSTCSSDLGFPIED